MTWSTIQGAAPDRVVHETRRQRRHTRPAAAARGRLFVTFLVQLLLDVHCAARLLTKTDQWKKRTVATRAGQLSAHREHREDSQGEGTVAAGEQGGLSALNAQRPMSY